MDSNAEFEDYLAVSETYDKWRIPVGLDFLEKALDAASEGVGIPKTSLKLLDVGCGTGNYINAIKGKVGTCTGLEFNKGMLATAQAKHKGDKRVNFLSGSAVDMDCFQDEEFDFVIITQVLHHLSMEMQRKAFVNIERVLKRGGALWISTFTPEQMAGGNWYHFLIPQASAMCAARVPGIPLLKHQLSSVGLKVASTDVVWESTIHPDKYLDQNGPFDENYRKADSVWSLATQEELDAGLAWWKEQIDNGTADSWLKKCEERRKDVGQTLAITCIKN